MRWDLIQEEQTSSTLSVAVAMSGGVDSSVVAAMMLEKEFSVIGVTFRMFDSSSTNAYIDDAARVADMLGIEHHVVDARCEFQKHVVEYFQKTYLSGNTPSPCIMCNQFVKLHKLHKFAQDNGCDKIATGHYARLSVQENKVLLSRAKDRSKDQSYFLYRVPRNILMNCLFPLGDYLKNTETRSIAKQFGLPVAVKADSQDVCFANTDWYKDFINKENTGYIIDEDYTILGYHKGITHYTIGQRKGLSLSGGPFFVKSIDRKSNQIVVSKVRPVNSEVNLKNIVWINEPYVGACRAKIRSQNDPVNCSISCVSNNTITAILEVGDCLSPGQHCVFFDTYDNVIGGGIIS